MEPKSDAQKKLPDISDFRKEQKEGIVQQGFKKNLVKYVRQFTDYTGIHGFKYVGEKGRHIFERLCWAVSFAVCLIICTILIIQTYKKWDTSPVLVSFSKAPESIWKVPFPAVTVCPNTKSKEGTYNYTEAYNKFMQDGGLTENELRNFSASSLICNNYIYSKGDKIVGTDSIDHIINIAPKLQNVFFHCRWDLHIDNCSAAFREVLTEDGLCFTANMLGNKEIFRDNVYLHNDDMAADIKSDGWSLENGYPETVGKDSFPRRAKYSGFAGSQVLILTDYEQDLDYSCKGPVQGFKIIIHNPAEVPRVSSNYLQSSLEEELLILITPDMMTTSKGVRDYAPHKRECFFSNERYLSFFQTYNQQNCEFECLTNHTLKKCGCVAFYMPYEKSTSICGPGSFKCMLDAQLELIGQTGDYRKSELNSEQNSGVQFACGCLPDCTSLTYNAEFSQSFFNWQKVFEGNRENMSELPGVHFTRLTMFFKESQFLPAERNELIGLADFLANCGGIFGLFTGFSFLSLVEIIYFLSLRFICNVKMYGRYYWSGSPKFDSS